MWYYMFVFFFQAEDGIRDYKVTGVQTCALPILNRLMEKTVFSGLVMAWRLATWPTSRSPLLVNPTTDGVVRVPSWLAMTVGWPASITATQEFVVPKSIPMIFPILQNPPQMSFQIDTKRSEEHTSELQ